MQDHNICCVNLVALNCGFKVIEDDLQAPLSHHGSRKPKKAHSEWG